MTAIISDCGVYRYRLERDIRLEGPIAAFIMVNPSTADAQADDATIRRVIGFARLFGWSKVLVGNVFAYRATDVRALAAAPDPVGPDNHAHLRAIFAEADLAVAAWGPLTKLPPNLRLHWQKVAKLAHEAEKPLGCLGTAKDGHPRHPLMLSYSSKIQNWLQPTI